MLSSFQQQTQQQSNILSNVQAPLKYSAHAWITRDHRERKLILVAITITEAFRCQRLEFNSVGYGRSTKTLDVNSLMKKKKTLSLIHMRYQEYRQCGKCFI